METLISSKDFLFKDREAVLKKLKCNADLAMNYGKFSEKGQVYVHSESIEAENDVLNDIRAYFVALPDDDTFIDNAFERDLSGNIMDYVADNLLDIQKFNSKNTRIKADNADVISKGITKNFSTQEFDEFYNFIKSYS